MEGVLELQSWSCCYSSDSRPPPPEEYLGPIFLTSSNFFRGGRLTPPHTHALSFFCPETMDETLHLGEEEKLFEPHQ